MMKIKEKIIRTISNSIKDIYNKEGVIKIETPPNIDMGDFALNCFALTKELGENPADIAKKIGKNCGYEDFIEKVEAVGPYLNIKIKNEALFATCDEIIKEKCTERSENKVMVEYLQPNTNKPLHLGHVRNGCIGVAVANILTSNGYDVIKANLINDRGIHICKSMIAWQKWGNGETPESSDMKGDHLVGKYYVKFASEAQKNPELEKEAQKMLKKWEDGDKEIRKIWEMMNRWVYKGFEATEINYGFKFDKVYFESETYKLGKDIVNEGLKKGVFHKDNDGFVVYDLPKEKFGLDKDGKTKKVALQRPDGTSLYITQDLGTAKKKFEEYELEKSIHVVGCEQDYHFQCLFSALESLGYDWAKKCYHLSYGMVFLPEGKMKSREGIVVDADDLLSDMQNLAKEEIVARNKGEEIDDKEIENRATKIAIAAIKFYLLNVTPRQTITFNPKESISFDGVTGPYCQYAYARAGSILSKAEDKEEGKVNYEKLGNNEERAIILKVIEFPNQLKIAMEEYNPARVTAATYGLATALNQFYQKHIVLSDEDMQLRQARLQLIKSAMVKIKEGLNILGIDIVTKM